jgi:hypothetical protein
MFNFRLQGPTLYAQENPEQDAVGKMTFPEKTSQGNFPQAEDKGEGRRHVQPTPPMNTVCQSSDRPSPGGLFLALFPAIPGYLETLKVRIMAYYRQKIYYIR